MLHLIISELTGDETPTEVQIGDTVVKLDDIKDAKAIVITESSSSGSSDNSGSVAESSAPAYAEGLETLAKEPAHTAGFFRIKDIFVKLGFATKVVEEEAAE